MTTKPVSILYSVDQLQDEILTQMIQILFQLFNGIEIGRRGSTISEDVLYFAYTKFLYVTPHGQLCVLTYT